MKPRLNIYLEYALMKELDAFAQRNGASKSGVVEAALMSFLSPDATDRREAAIARRLDRLTRQYARIERAQTVALETLALFVRHHLATTAPLPASERAAALAQGEERFAQFVEQLGRELAAAVGIGLKLWIAGIAIWLVGHTAAVYAARKDPKVMEALARHVKHRSYLAC